MPSGYGKTKVVIHGNVFGLALRSHRHDPLAHREASVGDVRTQRGDGSRRFEPQGGR